MWLKADGHCCDGLSPLAFLPATLFLFGPLATAFLAFAISSLLRLEGALPAGRALPTPSPRPPTSATAAGTRSRTPISRTGAHGPSTQERAAGTPAHEHARSRSPATRGRREEQIARRHDATGHGSQQGREPAAPALAFEILMGRAESADSDRASRGGQKRWIPSDRGPPRHHRNRHTLPWGTDRYNHGILCIHSADIPARRGGQAPPPPRFRLVPWRCHAAR